MSTKTGIFSLLKTQSNCTQKVFHCNNISMHVKEFVSVLLNTVVPSLDVMVLNDIIEQAAGRPGRASEQGGKYS